MATRSRVRELADAEAARAEAEDATEDEDAAEAEDAEAEDAEPEAEDEDAEPEGEPAELSADEVQRRIEAAHEHYEGELRALFAEGWADMDLCPLCNSLGYVASAGPVLKPGVELCGDCNGYGVQTTPSLVPEHVHETCLTCSGNGWRTQLTPVEPAPVLMNGAPNTATTVPSIPPMPIYDPTTNQWRDQFGNALGTVPG